MELSLRSDANSVLHVDVSGRINMAMLADNPEALSEMLEGGSYAKTVLLDMTEIDLIDSAGMSWLVVQHKRFCDAGGNFAIHSVPFSVLETLQVMRLDRVLNVADNESKALEMVQGAQE